MNKQSALESYFCRFRNNVIGHQQIFDAPFGKKEILYADWTASGRPFRPIEECIQQNVLPFVANTHTEATITGIMMSKAYEAAKVIVKQHVHADSDDVLIFCGSGMTGAVNKLQSLLGLRVPERIMDYVKKGISPHLRVLHNTVINNNDMLNEHLQLDDALRPVVFVTHMEHHSNHISWLETIATVEIIKPDEKGNVDVTHFRSLLERFKYKKIK